MSSAPLFAERPLLVAELHYFRVPRDAWEPLLARLCQLGATAVSTYVPWSWHEPRPGAIDLEGSGDPRRDLVGFIRLSGALGLRVILKPGPSGGADLLGGGVPAWLTRQHPEICALGPDGAPQRDASGAPRVCAHHPVYVAAARRWLEALAGAAASLQHPHGPVVALQVGHDLPPEDEPDALLKLDYNPHVLRELWPAWLKERGMEAGGRAEDAAESLRKAGGPLSLDDLRAYAALDEFADWCRTTAVASAVGWLREAGWHAPVFHELRAPWGHPVALADVPGLARAAGWLGQSACLADAGGQGLSFAAYVEVGHWRAKLLKSLSPALSSLVAATGAGQDLSLAAALLGGAEALCVPLSPRMRPESLVVGSASHWAAASLARADGGAPPRFWSVKALYTLLGSASGDFAGARLPADVALGYSRVPERVGRWAGLPGAADVAAAIAGCDQAARSQLLAQRLVSAGVTFDVIDLDAATPDALARYRLVVAPAAAMLARATQEKLAGCANLALVGDARARFDERLEPCTLLDDDAERRGDMAAQGEHAVTLSAGGAPVASAPHLVLPAPVRLPEAVGGDQLAELADVRGGHARYAWADTPDVDVSVRHGELYTWLFVANRRPEPYGGTLTYRAPDGSLQHAHVSMGAQRAGALLLQGDEIVGAAFGGDASEGGWIARAMRSSLVFNGGAGSVAPCGPGALLTAPQSGRFQLRRPEGWDGFAARRLLLHGALLPAALLIEAHHLTLPYVAEDERGQTDVYIVLPEGAMPPALRAYLMPLLVARGAMLRRAAGLCADAPLALAGEGAAPPALAEALGSCAQASASLARAADDLDALGASAFTLDSYAAAWGAAGSAAAPASAALAHALARARHERLAESLGEAAFAALEAALGGALDLIAGGALRSDNG